MTRLDEDTWCLTLGKLLEQHFTAYVFFRSNLNRQFLFRDADIQKYKAQAAVKAVKAMNPNANYTSMELRVGGETENVFNDKFFNNLEIVATQ